MTVSALPSPRRRAVPRQLVAARLVFITPAMLFYTTVVIAPIFVAFFYSFTDWSGFSATFNFVGGANFMRVLQDSETRQALLTTLLFTVINSPIQILIALLIALGLQRDTRTVRILRTVIVLPITLSGVVLGFTGNLIFDPITGLMRIFSQVPGLGFLNQNWLGDPKLAMATIIAMNIWQATGLTMLIFLAGLSTVPVELHEAARLDGASRFQEFRAVTWPLLAPAVTINVVLAAIGGFKVFDIIYVLTKGGPGTATQSIVMRANQLGQVFQYGYSSATSVVLTIITLVIALVLLGLLRRREVQA